MPPLVIRLLGRPEIERDGAAVAPPRGHKSWAVLAYLLLAERRVPRAQLAELIFADADDPLGALRWTLAQLRRALGGTDVLSGDPLALGLPAGTAVDVLALVAGEADPELARGELLEGVVRAPGRSSSRGCSSSAGAWPACARASCATRRSAGSRPARRWRPPRSPRARSRSTRSTRAPTSCWCAACRAPGRSPRRATTPTRARSCSGASWGARPTRGCAARPARRIRPPRPAAATAPPPSGSSRRAGRRSTPARAEPGVACLRQACAEARGVGDPALLAQALATLGTALVHAVRGRDEEGAAMLHEALALAEGCGDDGVAGMVCLELGFVEVQAGRATSAGRWLQRAGELAGDEAERAAVLAYRGMALSDRAHYEAAIALLGRSVAAAQHAGDARRETFARSVLGRAHLLRGDVAEAVEMLDASLALVESSGWVAFQPWPEALRAEAALRQDEPERAAALVDHAFALGCRLGDPCWEAMSARVMGLVHEAAGERGAALARLRDAAERAVRVADPYAWIHAYCLDALAGVAIADGAPDARACVAQLERVAAHGDMRELVVRAALHHARLGDAGGLASARLLAEAIDNPALHAELSAAV